MSTPVLHLLAGPNGAGKTTFVDRVLVPSTGLPVVNADRIAAEEWPDEPGEQSYDAARLASARRTLLIVERKSFVTETVFSHQSKVDLVRRAVAAGYLVHLYVILVPADLSVARVAERVRRGGHDVPERKIRERHDRLWTLVAQARDDADRTVFYDNSQARTPFREVARFEAGRLLGVPDWPSWTPETLTRGHP